MPDNAYRSYTPLHVLKPVASNIWIVDGPEIRWSYLGLKLPFPTRMTVVRLPDGVLWLHSPIEPTGSLVSSLQDVGPIGFLIAPNTLHYWWIPGWKNRFPNSQVYAPPDARRWAKRSLPEHQVLDSVPALAWAGVIDQVLIEGYAFKEIAFFHRPSRTLVLTDLIENFELKRVRQWWYRRVLSLSGVADPDGKAPIDMQLSFLPKRKNLRAAVEKMIAWEPERIIIAHGRWYDGNATAELRRAFRWVL